MKTFRFLPFLIAIMLVSCVKSPIDGTSPMEEEGMGLLKIGVSVDDGLQVKSKAQSKPMDPALVPLADSIYVDLYRKVKTEVRETWRRIYFGQYADFKDTLLRVNGGEWRMLAFHGDSTACGFDKPYFLADEYFTVKGYDDNGKPEVTSVDADVKVSNVRISVDIDKTVSGSFYDYFIRFTNLDKDKYKQVLRYQAGQTKDAYMMPSDSLQIEFMAQYEYGDETSWKYAILDTMVTNPNDHVLLSLELTNPRHGQLTLTINTDSTIVKKTSDLLINEEWLPQDAPQIAAAGFDESGVHYLLEGDSEGNGATVSAVARGGLKNFIVKFESNQLSSMGYDIPLNQNIDLTDMSDANKTALDKLKAAGFSWQEDMLNSRRLTYFGMTDFFETLNAKIKSQTTEREIFKVTMTVTDNVNKTITKVFKANSYPITQTLSIPSGNVWARRIVSPVINVGKGVSRLYKLQAKRGNESEWTDFASFAYATDSKIDFGTLEVDSDTDYQFRTIYNNNENLVSNVVSVRTEKELQVGNSGFEDYMTTEMTVSIDLSFGTTYQRKWYLPYKQGETDPWWAVNSKKTMPESHSVSGNNFKNFPCTGYSTNTVAKGEKSAMVYTCNVGWWNSASESLGDDVPGEIWIGKADDSGNHASDGHSFASRPDAVSFMYRYSPINSETFVVKAWVKDASGNTIATAEVLDGASSSTWQEYVLPLLYSNTTAKAASIYISFQSCASGEVNDNQPIEIAGETYTIHYGSVLWIDDVKMIYKSANE